MLTYLKHTLAQAVLCLMALLPMLANASEEYIHIHTDAFDNPVAATDANGNIVWKETYKPYGEQVNKQAASANNHLWFHGKSFDQSTGLSYFGARYYDPVLGRFMGVDPVDFREDNIHSFNRYAYGNNNPYRYRDPDGRDAKEVLSDIWQYNPWVAPIRLSVEAASNGQYGAAGFYAGAAVLPLVGKSGASGTVAKEAGEIGRVAAKAEVFAARTAPELKGIFQWGNGLEGVQKAQAALDANAMGRITSSMSRAEVESVRNFYSEAAAAGRGGAVAPARATFMENILKQWE